MGRFAMFDAGCGVGYRVGCFQQRLVLDSCLSNTIVQGFPQI